MMTARGAEPPALPAILLEDRPGHRLDLESRRAAETEALGRLLAAGLRPGDIICLGGSLGAGKTVLTRGIATGLSCQGAVTSPTFTLLIEHPPKPGGLALFHFDAYRLAGAADFCAAGLDEYFDAGGVCVVEWGEIIREILPARTLTIQLEMAEPESPDRRRISLAWPDQPDRLLHLADDLRLAAAKKGKGGEIC